MTLGLLHLLRTFKKTRMGSLKHLAITTMSSCAISGKVSRKTINSINCLLSESYISNCRGCHSNARYKFLSFFEPMHLVGRCSQTETCIGQFQNNLSKEAPHWMRRLFSSPIVRPCTIAYRIAGPRQLPAYRLHRLWPSHGRSCLSSHCRHATTARPLRLPKSTDL